MLFELSQDAPFARQAVKETKILQGLVGGMRVDSEAAQSVKAVVLLAQQAGADAARSVVGTPGALSALAALAWDPESGQPAVDALETLACLAACGDKSVVHAVVEGPGVLPALVSAARRPTGEGSRSAGSGAAARTLALLGAEGGEVGGRVRAAIRGAWLLTQSSMGSFKSACSSFDT